MASRAQVPPRSQSVHRQTIRQKANGRPDAGHKDLPPTLTVTERQRLNPGEFPVGSLPRSR